MTESAAVLHRAKTGWVRSIFRLGRNISALLGVILLSYHLFFDLSEVVSPSMSPTLQGTKTTSGDWVLTERITYHFRSPRRWELIQFHDEEGVSVIKRAVGLPGEHLSLRAGQPVIGQSVVSPPAKLNFLHYYEFGPYLHAGKRVDCGDQYFLLGDDSRDSFDSRFMGPISNKQITGRPMLIVWPFSRFGWVNP